MVRLRTQAHTACVCSPVLRARGDPISRASLAGDELLPAVDVVGRARERRVAHDVHGKRGDVVGFMGQWDYKNFTVEDMAAGLIRFDNGATVVLESSFVANLKDEINNTTLLGTAGGASAYPLTITQERASSSPRAAACWNSGPPSPPTAR